MSDTLSTIERSRHMALVRAKNTNLEKRVRLLIHKMGYGFCLNVNGLPGKPDIVFHHRRKIIFIHGCFWHQHDCTMGNRIPKSRIEFWKKKLDGNKRRDRRVKKQLARDGWSVMIVWECETKVRNISKLKQRIKNFLDST